jgi:hypothetical protein
VTRNRAQRALQQVLVGELARGGDGTEGVGQRLRVAAGEGDQDALQRGLLQGVEAADRAEVQQRQAAIGKDEHVAGVGVGVEDPAAKDLLEHAGKQHPGQPGAVGAEAVQQRSGPLQAGAVDELGDQQPPGGQLRVDAGDPHRRGRAELVGDGDGVVRLDAEVQLLDKVVREPPHEIEDADLACPAGLLVQAAGEPCHDVEVAADEFLDAGTQRLDRHLGARR